MQIQLSFHKERVQPLSDLVGNADAKFYLTSEKPCEVNISIMTSRGLSYFERITLDATMHKVPYDPPWGLDWSVLQLAAVKSPSLDEEPYEVTLIIESNP